MKYWITILCVLCTLCSCYCKTFRIAWMAPDPGSGREITSYTSVAAIKLALSSVLSNAMILKGHNIEVKYFRTDCTSHMSMQSALMARNTYNPDVIIGPPCKEGMRIVAQLCSFWNLPVFSWYNPGIEFDNINTFPTLVRMIPSLSTMGSSLMHLLRQNNWDQFAFIYDDSSPWTLYEEAVRVEMAHTQFRMLSSHDVNSSISDLELWRTFSYIKKYAWVIVLACPCVDVRRYMLIAEQAGMADGSFIFIQLDHQMHSEKMLNDIVMSNRRWMRGDAHDQAARKAYQSLIHVLTDAMNDDDIPTYALPRNRYNQFTRMAALEVNKQTPGWSLPVGGQPDVYSLYLYDSILVWAVLVDSLHKARKNHRDGKLLAQEAKSFVADGASGFISINDKLDRCGKVFIMYMEAAGSFKPSQILKYNKSDGYEIINIKPVREQLMYHGGQTNASVNLMLTAATTTATTQATTAVATRQTIATMLGRHPVKIAKAIEMHQPPTGNLMSRLLARLESLENSIKKHNSHFHKQIPYHPHTPSPRIPDHAHTPHPIFHRMTTPSPLAIMYAGTPKPAATAYPPPAVKGNLGVMNYAQVPPVYGNQQLVTDHPHHWHPHLHYQQQQGQQQQVNQQQVHQQQNHQQQSHQQHSVQQQQIHVRRTHVNDVYVPTTHTPPPPTLQAATTIAIPAPTVKPIIVAATTAAPTTSAPVAAAPAAAVNEALINRITARLMDQLIGANSTAAATTTNNRENQIVSDIMANGLEELGLPPEVIQELQAAREHNLIQQANIRRYQQLLQLTNNSRQQQTPNTLINNNPIQTQQSHVDQWRLIQPPIHQDPLAAVLDPLAGIWGPPLLNSGLSGFW